MRGFDEAVAAVPVDVGHLPRASTEQQYPGSIDALGEKVGSDGADFDSSCEDQKLG